MAPPQKATPKRAKPGKKSKKNKTKQMVPGQQALGTALQGPLALKTEQFASWAPLETFSVSKGSTPGGVRVKGRELIGATASGSTTLLFGANGTTSAAAIQLNPGSFSRLSAYNPIYEFFKFHRAKAMFKSNQATTSNGVAMLAVDYDSKDALPTTTTGMMRNISSSMSNIYADNSCEVLGSLSRLPKYATSQATASDLDQVNQAQILYAFEGVTGVSVAQGYLIIEYDVEFFTPQ